MKKSNKQAFTLIELLVVVLIIGILAAVAVPQYQKAVEKARAAEAITLLNSIQKGIDAWVLTNGMPTVDTYFIEFFDGNEKAELDIDVESALTCEEVGKNTYCHSKYFRYSANCNTTSCYIEAARFKDDAAGDYEYALLMNMRSEGWKKECYYWGDTPAYAKSLCESLAAQGWDPSDES